jgi:predicted O-methyltransferase YrrM
MQRVADEQDRSGCAYSKVILQCMLKLCRPKTVVEIGVQFGETTRHLCEGAKGTGMVYGFDLWDKHGLWGQFDRCGSKEEAEARIRSEGYTNFELTQINSRTPEFHELLAQKCPSIDFAFIDGCHSYDGVKNDFEAVYPKLTPLGIIAFNDTRVIDGAREFTHDLRTKFFDGTFDIMELPYGSANRMVGWTYLIKRPESVFQPMDEVCGAPHNFNEIYAIEQAWLNTEIETYKKGNL